jgi:UDP-glucose 4-epimerase
VRPILVTGGAGYIGSHVVLALLDRGFEPIVVDNFSTGTPAAVPPGVCLEVGDVGDSAFMRQVFGARRPAAVLHFAGSVVVEQSVREPLRYFRNNTSNSLTLIEATIAAGCNAFIFSSTAAVYGDADHAVVDEGAATRPITPYGVSKLMTETMLGAAAAAHPGFRPVILRYFNVAGADPIGRAGQRMLQPTHLVGAAIDVALGRKSHLQVYGDDYDTRDGTCERDFIHVTDLASAHVAALSYLIAGGEPAVFNCGYGRGYTVREVVSMFEALLDRALPVQIAARRTGDMPRLIADASRLRSVLGWSPQHDNLEDILSTALDWQRALTTAP